MATLSEQHEWFAQMSAFDRSRIAAVAEAGFTNFCTWYLSKDATHDVGPDFFGAAPSQLARRVTLRQTLQILRTCVNLVESHSGLLRLPGKTREVSEAAVRFSRDVAFAAAEVYANAAEIRGAWDERLETLLMDSLVRGDDPDTVASLRAALGWDDQARGAVIICTAPAQDAPAMLRKVRRGIGELGIDLLVGLQQPMMVLLVSTTQDGDLDIAEIATHLPSGPVAVEQLSGSLDGASVALAAARSAWLAAPGWPQAPRPVFAEDILPERVLQGDSAARAEMLERFYEPLVQDQAVAQTVWAYLAQGKNLEATARVEFVHPNTVRYRLRKCAQLINLDPTDGRDGFVLEIALTLGALEKRSL